MDDRFTILCKCRDFIAEILAEILRTPYVILGIFTFLLWYQASAGVVCSWDYHTSDPS
ncbi:hypothetical protein KsCSTR_25400 [Candidatus Kuenenia stuttgartiensis]|uniref:Uncharacterized protein n=1 Tax=Kuenenia stuttgartiensis TaxID=174633 RepID=A0A6G7GRI7_KUEST|nr:hypothetical protein KsCSTR_25400 [Candidatus Kuenenia stuttgartiensis]